MGARGKGAGLTGRAPHKNTRPNARTRDKIVMPESPGYWDLVLGHHRGAPFWADPADPERAEAWSVWGPSILARWAMWYGMGHRPAGWFTFDAPVLAAKAGISAAILAGMEYREIIHALSQSPKERAMIEGGWRQNIRNTHLDGMSRAKWRKRAREAFAVPRWFFDLEAAE